MITEGSIYMYDDNGEYHGYQQDVHNHFLTHRANWHHGQIVGYAEWLTYIDEFTNHFEDSSNCLFCIR